MSSMAHAWEDIRIILIVLFVRNRRMNRTGRLSTNNSIEQSKQCLPAGDARHKMLVLAHRKSCQQVTVTCLEQAVPRASKLTNTSTPCGHVTS